MNKNLPKIAIVGRPNVGKSSLFNAIIRKKKSLVDPVAGITRDRITDTALLDKRIPVCFIDTGGISKREEHLFVEEITNSARQSVEEADLIVFVIEAGNFSQDDQEIAELLRKKAADKTIVVVNKVDNNERENLAYEAYSLGFEKVLFTSAAHRRGIEELITLLIETLHEKNLISESTPIEANDENAEDEEEDILKLSLFGRPNAGKSSFLNLVLGEDRSIVSDIPGTTRDVVEEFFEHRRQKIRILDTAGVRRRARIKEKIEYVSVKKSLSAIKGSDIVLLLLDAQEGITEQDKRLVKITLEHLKGLIIGINKWDLVAEDVDKEEYIDQIRFHLSIAKYVPVMELSVKKNYNVSPFLNKALKIYDNYKRKISTNELTEFLRETIALKPLFSKHGDLKIYYSTQSQSKPPVFEIFVNNPTLIHNAYHRFLQHSVRDYFGFEGVPLKLNIHSRRKKEKE